MDRSSGRWGIVRAASVTCATLAAAALLAASVRPTFIVVPIAPDYLAIGPAGQPVSEPRVALTSVEDGVRFDVDGDGIVERVSWTEKNADVAFLALDVNGDRQINNGKELFGRHTLAVTTTGADALIKTFENTGEPGAGSLEDGMALYAKLLLWVDRNHDGVSQPHELIAASTRFAQIGMGFLRINRSDEHGNTFFLQGWTEVRSENSAGRAKAPGEHFPRVRRMFEVALLTEPR